MERFVITVARETGSGGHDITRKLSEALGVPYYDRDLLRLASEVSGIHERLFGAADERIGLRQMLSAAEKVYTGEILPPDSDDYIPQPLQLPGQDHQGTGGNRELHHPGPVRQLLTGRTTQRTAGIHPCPG